MVHLLTTLSLLAFSSLSWASCPSGTSSQLEKLLTKSSTISTSRSSLRWSDFHKPSASLYVKIGCEEDVAAVVKYANRHNYQFLLQNGGNGWADTFHLGGCSLIIDISPLKQVTFNKDRTVATIQGGVTDTELVAAGYAHQIRFANPTCNCVGFLGAALGGGLTRTSGLYGWSTDQLISANVVLASGKTVQVDAKSNPDLWWALRGAAANFGIVTSANIKSYPQPGQDLAWQASIFYADHQITAVMQAVNDLYLAPHMQVDFLFSTSGAPHYTPIITVIPLFTGTAKDAEAAFAPLLRLKPTNISASEIPYSQWNAFGDGFCQRGGRKPAYAASTAQINATTFTTIYDEFKALIASNPTAFGNSVILAENYPTAKAVALGGATSSFPFRDLSHHIVAIPWYNDTSLDAQANAWGVKVRDLMWSTAGTPRNSSYINFAHGDEPLETIYGTSLPRLQVLKKIYDPLNRFNQWFPLTR